MVESFITENCIYKGKVELYGEYEWDEVSDYLEYDINMEDGDKISFHITHKNDWRDIDKGSVEYFIDNFNDFLEKLLELRSEVDRKEQVSTV